MRPVKLTGLLLGTRESIAGTVYGTIVVLSAITAGAKPHEEHLWRLGAIMTVTVLVFWGAHVYSHGLAESIHRGRRLTAVEAGAIARREVSIALAAVLPLLAIALGALGIVRDRTAVWLAVGVGVAILGAEGVRYARLERLSLGGTIFTVALNLSLGLAFVALKVIVTH
jgi:hypothetical protein